MYKEKRYIPEKYADDILQLAWKYKNENPDQKGWRMYEAMDRTLETMDKYAALINNMGYMMYKGSVLYMAEYIDCLLENESGFSKNKLSEIRDYLLSITY